MSKSEWQDVRHIIFMTIVVAALFVNYFFSNAKDNRDSYCGSVTMPQLTESGEIVVANTPPECR